MSIKVIPGELNVQATSEDLNLNVGKQFNVNAGDNITIKTSDSIVQIIGDIVIIRAPQIALTGNVHISGNLTISGTHPFAEAGHGH